MKTLVVEPAKLYREILGKIFQENACTYTVVTTAAEALSAVERDKYNLICVSMQLPDMTGPQLTMRIRATENGLVVPVALLTADDSDDKNQEAYIGGVTEVFNKRNLEGLAAYISRMANEKLLDEPLTGHLLYIEDSNAVANATKSMLEQHSLIVDHFTTAESALQAFEQHDYDMVLTDIILEGKMSGLGLVNAIRDRSDSKANIPVLAVSGYNDTTRKIELLRSGVNDYISKPVVEEELWARVKNLILNRQLQRRIEAQQKRLEALATTDQLTGLYNRHFLMDMGPRKLSEARRHQFALSLVVVDVDKFKNVNDTHGHSTGDEVLKAVGRLLEQSCRNEDVAARFGGEEFVLILPHCQMQDAIAKAEKLRIALSELMPAGLPLTASFGVSTLDLAGKENFGALFDAADKAVYLAKESGRNCVKEAA